MGNTGESSGHGRRTALVGANARVTFAELGAAVSEASEGLGKLGVTSGDVVALALAPGVDLVAAIAAVWSRGAVAVPCNCQWWPRELAATLDATEADLVLASPTVQLGNHEPRRTVLVGPASGPDTLLGELRGQAARRARPPWPLEAEDLVAPGAGLWASTTGCTGEPRTFAFDTAQLRDHWLTPLPEAPATVSTWTDTAHAPTLRFVLGALGAGATVHVAQRWAPRRALGRLADEPVEVLWASGPQLAQAARTAAPELTGREQPLAATTIAIGGPLHRRAAAAVARRFGGIVGCSYVCTEAGGWVTGPGGEGALIERPTGRFGPVTSGLDLHVAGPGVTANDLAGTGARRGEAHIGGPASAVATGGRAPRARPGPGWSTGDLAEHHPVDGLAVVGRLTDVFLTDGRPVYPSEVEMALADDPRIADVVVVPRPHPERGMVGVAVTVPTDPEHPPFLMDLASVQATLPAHAWPVAQWVTEQLPLSAAGHIQRRLLVNEEAGR